ncbi:hypothetical protein COHA_007351 [Chlorella ohadii]|uniref:F-box domain-containing protein n=1 Tax=Chlorella ohadii TaxID=2649997 RepID=A0AAD5DL29_9CHLO|nr:hypothetical protein COHA_007351 [Chlorella ohadii]
MTTRARARTSRASGTPLMLAQLPDEVLLHTLGFIDFRERQRVALVSKRFAALCGSPALLRESEIYLCTFADADSAAAWLLRHARHVRRLELEIEDVEDVGPAASIATAIATCFAVAGAAAQLDELCVIVEFDLHTRSGCALCARCGGLA